jgi:hypothetical protein
MSAKFNRKAIMQAAHFMARWREGNGRTYRERFAAALAFEWKKAREARAAAERRNALALEQATGLPLRTCLADKPSVGAFAFAAPGARRLFTRHSGRIAGAFAA